MITRTQIQIFGALAFCLFFNIDLAAQPDLSGGFTSEGWPVFPDLQKAGRYYYGPGPLRLAAAPDGKPDAVFVLMRQSGNAADGRANQFHYNSLFQCRVLVEHPDAARLQRIRDQLGAENKGTPASLDPLPVWKTEALLAVPAVEGKENRFGGVLENSDTDAAGEFWTERLFTAKLAPADAQLLEKALSIGQSTLHLQYTFFAKGPAPGQGAELQKMEQFEGTDSSSVQLTTVVERDSQLVLQPVLSDALPLGFDTRKYPDLIRKIDINAQAPPGYALLEVRCYDFNNALRDDLFGKRIEVEAEGVSGQKVKTTRTFFAAQPDVYVQSLRFPYAVKLDRPLRYRVTELSEERPPLPGAWLVWKNWNALIDITSR